MSKQQQQSARGRSNKVMIFTCALVLVAALIIGLLINNATAGSRFESEIVAMNDAFSSGNNQKIDEVLKRTVSSGNYARVETSLKSYVGDLVTNINDIKAVTDNEAVYDSLEGSYLAKNAGKLDETIVELTEASKKVDELTKNADKLYNEEDVKAYIKDQQLGENYSQLFIENAKLFYDDDELRDNYKNTLKLLRSSIAVEIEAIEYLKNHRSDWEIKDNQLKFKNDAISKEYTKILEKVAKM
ncbi:hypothetical protein J5500_04430 [Candidatus Saccharibacteria bacterium]|nr:hypothetical protein [Candidatus Saccharibacteria bacterium]